ncbi:MAG: glycosyltransferase [Actinobacteria bacterium]|nr:glycosyltransferase [Actinomycetota bacterium]MBU1943730.1 glycosyltransferase [Actinomycetota bacterium]MBU2687064.1 glycosyltransferase [Actinomycetota bacterium]
MGIDTTIMTVLFIALVIYYLYICILAVMVKDPSARPHDSQPFHFVFMIPCRNEEAVIAVTIRRLLEVDHPDRRILVINDGSTDSTEEVVKTFAETGAVEVITTVDSGRGKGEALNFGFRHVLERLADEGITSYENVLIGILDADGQPSPNICSAVEPFFDDPEVGAVQTAVRIANADSNLIAACQDIEFTGFSRSIQRGRDRLGSVGLGGNGQFARLSALASLSMDRPWNTSLTEDLDIGIRLIQAGWKVRFCAAAYVAQQGVEKFRPLIVQRVRWMQGHYTCWKYIPSLLRNRNLRVRTRLDNSAYLVLGVTPFIVFLSIVLSFLAAVGAITVYNKLADMLLGISFLLYILMFYFLSFVIAIVFVTFYARAGRMSFWRLVVMYNVFAVYTLMWIPASFGAVINLVRGETVWVKTGRTEILEYAVLRDFPRVELSIPVSVTAGGRDASVTIRDASAGGIGVQLTKKAYLDGPIRVISTGNRVEVRAPVSGRTVAAEVVWVAYLGRNQVRSGLRFTDPPTVDVHDDFGYASRYI